MAQTNLISIAASPVPVKGDDWAVNIKVCGGAVDISGNLSILQVRHLIEQLELRADHAELLANKEEESK